MSQPSLSKLYYRQWFVLMAFMWSPFAYSVSVDGKGHYAARGESRQNPGFNGNSAFQAIDQFFRLEAEVRTGSKASFLTEFRIFEDPRNAYLGDTAEPSECAPLITYANQPNTQDPDHMGSADNCSSRHQNSLEPGYKAVAPKIRKVYARYQSDLCLFEVGRRGRDWGLGILYDAGNDLFDTSSSVFDGLTCDMGFQKNQDLGVSFGFDKLAETGKAIVFAPAGSNFGPMNQDDDLEQYFVTIEYDNTDSQSKEVNQKIGLYLSNILSSGDELKTDIKIADLYLGIYLPSIIFRNEIVMRFGESADPSFTRLGGSQKITKNYHADNSLRSVDVEPNKVDALAIAGRLDFILAKSGAIMGPKQAMRGDFSRHSLFLEYAMAPGDSDGYVAVRDSQDQSLRSDNNAKAIAFHSNYKPALLLFNGRSEEDSLRTDGVYDPYRVMNTKLFGLGYEFHSMESGTFSVKLLTGSLDQGPPSAVKAAYEAALAADPNRETHVENRYHNRLHAPIGYKGTDLGFELDLDYRTFYERGFEIGGALAVAAPGKAWHIESGKSPKTQFLLQAFAGFEF